MDNQPSIDLNSDKAPFTTKIPKIPFKGKLTLMSNVGINIEMTKVRQPPEKRSKYYVYKNSENSREFEQSDITKTIRYGKSILYSKRKDQFESSRDGLETLLGEEHGISKYDRSLQLLSFVEMSSVPVTYFSGPKWKIEASPGNMDHQNLLLVLLNKQMLEKQVYGIAKFVLVKGYNLRLVVLVPTEDGLYVKEIPWGELFIADGIKVTSESDQEQKDWMKAWIDELPESSDIPIRNPLLERVWHNVLMRSQQNELADKISVGPYCSISDKLRDEAVQLFNWKGILDLD
ncbi:Ku domain-containing protein [Entamoeba marina]